MIDLFETGLCAALVVGSDGTIERANRGWEEIHGWAPAELEGRRLSALCRPEHVERIEMALENLGKGAPSAIVRARFPHGHKEHELMLRFEPAGDAVLATAEDISVRTAILPRESQLQSLVDFASESWFVHDLEGRIRDANPHAYESLGYTRAQILELYISDIEATIEPGRLDGVWNRMEVGKSITVEGRHVRKDGSEIPMEVRLGLFTTEDDEILMLAVARDVTERNEQRAKLLELNHELTRRGETLEDEVMARTGELRAVIDNLADGLVAIDRDGVVVTVNRGLGRLLGLETVTLGNRAEDVLPAALVQLARECGEHDEVRQVELPLPGERIGRAVASPVSEAQSALSAVMLLRDVTLEKEIDSMKTNFISMVSHELRTPLTSVLGFAKLTKGKLEKQIFPHISTEAKRVERAVGQVRGNVDIIIAEGQRLTLLIDDVLDIAKMEAGRMEWDMAPIDPGELVARALGATASLFDGDGPIVESHVDPGLPAIQGDFDRLLQVIINLLSNSAKFTETGSVRVSARAIDGDVHVSVEDSGEGIDPALHESVFEKFKQVGDTLTDKPKGTGLGLPICKQIIDAHGGEIWVDSALGKGAKFTFRIPRVDGVLAELPAVRHGVDGLVSQIEREALEHGTAGRDILVVDDDASLRELLHQELTDRGFAVRLATDGFEAIEQVRTRRPDLVILDVMMPGLSGFDVAAMLKNDPATQAIPILILTIVADEKRGLRLGVDRYLRKPMEADALVLAVRDLLANGTSQKRVLVVDERNTATSDVSRLLETKGYEVVATCTGAAAIELAREHRPDLIIVEALDEDHADLIRSIRFERDLEHVLVIQLLDGV